MAFYVDTSTFDPVYQLEVSDPALGGVDGVANRQAAQIANRTKYLKDRIQAGHSLAGEHDLGDILAAFIEALTNAEFANSAAVAESKIAFELVGKTRPADRGTYATTAQLAQDVYDVAVGAISAGTVAASYINEYLETNHDTNPSAHADIVAQYNRVAALNSQLLKDALITKLYAENVVSTTYADGFILDCGSGTQLNATDSSGWSVDTVGGSFYPTPGATGQTATYTYNNAANFIEENVQGTGAKFIVDTANTSGHFVLSDGTTRVTVGAGQSCPKVLKGCRIVIGGTSYGISGITGDGSANNAVAFSGTLAAGTYTVTGVYGTVIGSTCTLNKVNDGANDVPPLSTTYAVVSNTALTPNPASWLAITGMTSINSIGGSNAVYGAVSVDGVNYKVFTGGSWVIIAKNNAGTWQYYNGVSFVNASVNSAVGALSQAFTVAGNQVGLASFTALTPTDWSTLGAGTVFNVALGLRTTDSTTFTVPSVTSVSSVVTLKIPGMTLVTLHPGTLSLAYNPLKARVSLELVPGGAMNMDTDLDVYVSKNGGTTFTAMDFVDVVQTSPYKYLCSWEASSLPATDTRNMVIKVVSPQGLDFDCTLMACFTI